MSDNRTAGMPQNQQFQHQNPVQYYYAPMQPAPQMYQVPVQEFKGGYHPLYSWAIACLALTYGYIVLYFISASYLSGFSATHDTKLPLVFFLFPLGLTVANLVISLTYGRNLDRRYLLGAALILKYGLIPYFVFGGMVIAIFFLLIFTPVVIMIFVSPPIIFILSVIGWVTLCESAPFMVVYFVKAAREGAFSGNKARTTGNILFAVFGCIMQMFFCLDVLAAVIACFKEKRHVKLTICVLAAPAVIFCLFMAVVVGYGLIKTYRG